MDSKIKKLVAGAALAGALTVGTAGVAVAADGSTTPADPSAQAAKHPGLRIKVRRGAVKVVTETLGVSRQDLRDAMKGGQTLTQYATSLGKDPQALAEALSNAATTKLDQLVADGTITQERADTVKSKLPARIDKVMNRQFGQHASA
jgi:uncharacterized protein YidB (DUF937 family)